MIMQDRAYLVKYLVKFGYAHLVTYEIVNIELVKIVIDDK